MHWEMYGNFLKVAVVAVTFFWGEGKPFYALIQMHLKTKLLDVIALAIAVNDVMTQFRLAAGDLHTADDDD